MKIQKRPTPEVVTGARGPREERKAVASQSAAKRNPVAFGDDKIVFQSRYANHRIQVTAPPDLKDPFTGRLTQGRPKVAQFREHILMIKKDDEDTLHWLTNHPNFKIDFWLLSDVIEEGKRQEREQAKRVLMDPEQREAILAELKESGDLDFSLPKTQSEDEEPVGSDEAED
jgi:hypothetical protein